MKFPIRHGLLLHEIPPDAEFNTISDNFISSPKAYDDISDLECVYVGYNAIYFKLNKNRLSEITQDGVVNWFKSNPTTVCWVAYHESIKTVDLSAVDQDGNDTKLSTFEDITYVTLSSEGLIPEAELEVDTKNEEVLNTMSLEMDDISTTQNALQETSDTQSENVDATMIATTEIYEELL